jgi:hypothetical protein
VGAPIKKEDNMGYAGAGWVKTSLKKRLCPLGEAVADLLGDVFRGIYHLPSTSLNKVKWDDNYCIEFTYYGDLATVDFNLLTTLVVLAHDRMIRVSIQGVGPGYMRMMFHQRKSRTGSVSERYPTIETHIEQIREHFK